MSIDMAFDEVLIKRESIFTEDSDPNSVLPNIFAVDDSTSSAFSSPQFAPDELSFYYPPSPSTPSGDAESSYGGDELMSPDAERLAPQRLRLSVRSKRKRGPVPRAGKKPTRE